MTISNVTLGKKDATYGPFSYGTFAGEPVVDFTVSKQESEQLPVQSIESILDGWGWKRKLDNGFCRLQYNGHNVFDDYHREGIEGLTQLLDPRFVDFEVSKRELKDKKPPRGIQNIADYYRVFVPSEFDFDRDVMEFFGNQSQSHGNVDFVFKIDNEYDEEYVKEIVREYGIYDSDVWLYPRGTQLRTTLDAIDAAYTLAKRNTWNFSPRIELMMNVEEGMFEDDE